MGSVNRSGGATPATAQSVISWKAALWRPARRSRIPCLAGSRLTVRAAAHRVADDHSESETVSALARGSSPVAYTRAFWRRRCLRAPPGNAVQDTPGHDVSWLRRHSVVLPLAVFTRLGELSAVSAPARAAWAAVPLRLVLP